MSAEAEQRIDMTGFGDELRYVEIFTDAGIVRVNTNLVNVHTGAAAVVVEVERYPGWEPEVTSHLSRTDVTLREKG